MKYKGVIFDMDGVIFDSERYSRDCYREACEKCGYQFDNAFFLTLMGATYQDCEARTEAWYGKEGARIIDEEYRTTYPQGFYEGKVPLKYYAYELINWLKDNNVPIALATSTNRAQATINFECSPFHGIPFDHMITGEIGAKSKPDPEVFLKAADALNLDIKDCVIIEDSLNGVKAAIASGGISIMVPDLIEPTEELRQQVDYIKKDLYEVYELLNS